MRVLSEEYLDMTYFKIQNYPDSFILEYRHEIKKSRGTCKVCKRLDNKYKDIILYIKKQLKEKGIAGIDYVMLLKYSNQPWNVGIQIGNMCGLDTTIRHSDYKIIYRKYEDYG